jgi:serine dehydrogenase proteinase
MVSTKRKIVMPAKTKSTPKNLVDSIEDHYDADLLVYFGPIYRPWDDCLIDLCAKREKRKNVLLMLTTLGGDAHSAYRMARYLQQSYCRPESAAVEPGQLIIFVNGVCASAGTLVTLAADKLILTNHTELGPLDVQMRKPDEVGERTSGLTPIQALGYLEGQAQKFFASQFDGLRKLAFSTRMAADVAAQLASGLLSKLYEQIDPLRLAEYDRSNRIAEHYGDRIKTKNVKEDAVKRLLECYPSHEFCIDTVEAKELFDHVEKPTPALEMLGNRLKQFAQKYLLADEPAIFFLTDRSKPNEESHETKTPNVDRTKSQRSIGRGVRGRNRKVQANANGGKDRATGTAPTGT